MCVWGGGMEIKWNSPQILYKRSNLGAGQGEFAGSPFMTYRS